MSALLGNNSKPKPKPANPMFNTLISKRNARYFEGKGEKLDGWADDLKVGWSGEIKGLDKLIKEARRAATTLPI